MARIYREHELQKACVTWFRLKYPKYGKLLHAVPNGGFRNLQEAKRFKAEGVTAGYPDLSLEMARQGYNSLKIEMKTDKGKLSDNQREIIALLQKHNHRCVIVTSIEGFIEQIDWYLRKQ